MNCTGALICGIAIGLALAAIAAAWVYVRRTKGWDHPLTEEEMRARVGEAFGG